MKISNIVFIIILNLIAIGCGDKISAPNDISSNSINSIGKIWEQTNGPYGGVIYRMATTMNGDIFISPSGRWLFRSTDDGESWTRLDSVGGGVSLLVTNNSGYIFKFMSGKGIFRSTDNGNSWEEVNNGLPNKHIRYLSVGSNGYIYAAVSNNGIYHSTDNGENWRFIGNGIKELDIRIIATNSNGDIIAGTPRDGAFLSTNNGESWSSIGLDSISITSIIVSEEGTIYVGGRGGGPNHNFAIVFKSVDNGNNWIELGWLYSNFLDDIKLDSENNLYVGGDNGLYLYNNANGIWEELFEGMFPGGINVLDFDLNGNLLIGSETAGLIRLTNENTISELIGIPNSSITAITANTNGDIFACTDFDEAIRTKIGIYRTSDNGKNWNRVLTTDGRILSIVNNQSGDIYATEEVGGTYMSTDNGDSWINIDRSNFHFRELAITLDGTLIAGRTFGDIYQSNNNGDSWILTNDGLPQSMSITAIQIGSNNNIFLGTYSDGVFQSTDNGFTWISIGLQNQIIWSITLNSAGHMFVGTDGSGIYRTIDGGNNWESINNNLTSFVVYSLTIDSNDNLFAGMLFQKNYSEPSGGVYRSVNNGDSWEKYGLPETTINSMAFNIDNHILAGTDGSGVTRSIKSTLLE